MIQNQFNYLPIVLYHFEFEFLFLGDFSRQPVKIVRLPDTLVFFVFCFLLFFRYTFFYKNKFIRISRLKFQKFKNMICINLKLIF